MPKPSTSGNSSYGRRKPQIKEQDLYMLMALWMEQSPWRATGIVEKVVGAVFVTPNDRVLSVDCSRSNDCGVVHGAIRALLQYPDQVEGCYVYLSRQPCAHCVKMLVQAAVKKVFYLPLKPEKDELEENKRVDALFKVSPVSREVYVPNITDDDVKELDKSDKPYDRRELQGESVAPKEEWDSWKKEKIEDKIGWEEYSDPNIKEVVKDYMEQFLDWYKKGILATGWENTMKWKDGKTGSELDQDRVAAANHLSRLAQMLSHRTDDPTHGVGCVIADEDKKEIVAIGWNSYPSEAQYGNHPRGSKLNPEKKQKYAHIIYALENAVLHRNRPEVGGCVVYHTIVPSDEGVSMLYQLGARVLVLPSFTVDDKLKESFPLFCDGLQNKKFTVFKQIGKETSA